jgi:hypothetical protein
MRCNNLSLSFKNICKDIYKVRARDLVDLKTIWADGSSRYLVIRVSKKDSSVDVLPLEQFYKNQEKIEAPVLSVPFYMIESINKIDKSNLLFLANHPNPHITNALENL